MANFSVVPCGEEHGTAKENFSLEDWTATVTLRCDWVDRHSLAADLLTNSRSWPHSPYALAPQASTVVIRADETAFVTVGQGCEYIHALLDVSYSSTKRDLISESLEPNVEFSILDHRRFRWGAGDGDPLLEGESTGMLKRSLNLVRTLYQVEPPLPIVLLTGVGGVNHADYTSDLLGLTFAQETLLFAPPQLSRTIRTDGSDGFNITMKFSYKPDGWNKYWRAKTQSYQRIHVYGESDPYYSYPKVDYSDLLA